MKDKLEEVRSFEKDQEKFIKAESVEATEDVTTQLCFLIWDFCLFNMFSYLFYNRVQVIWLAITEKKALVWCD